MATIRVKNSSVPGKAPTSDQLEIAELAINVADRKLYSKGADGVFQIGAGASVPGGDTPPSQGNEIGDLFFDTTTNALLYWDGTSWVPVAGGEEANELDDLSDVTILNPQSGELLVWNGSQWVNADPGYLTEGEINNILNGLNPDGTENPGSEGFLKPGDNVSELNNDAGYLTSEDLVDPDGADFIDLPYVPLGSWAELPNLEDA